jgi:hypothetical protein
MSSVPAIKISETRSFANLLSTHICMPATQTNIIAKPEAAIDKAEHAIE